MTKETTIAISQLEGDAGRQNVTLLSLALDREYPYELLPLAATLDAAIAKEHLARMYGIDKLRREAERLRTVVADLAYERDLRIQEELDSARTVAVVRNPDGDIIGVLAGEPVGTMLDHDYEVFPIETVEDFNQHVAGA